MEKTVEVSASFEQLTRVQRTLTAAAAGVMSATTLLKHVTLQQISRHHDDEKLSLERFNQVETELLHSLIQRHAG